MSTVQLQTVEQERSPGVVRARRGTMCIVVADINDGEGAAIARNLRRHGTHYAIVLARRAEQREVVQLLAGGVRGAIAIEPGRGMHLIPRPARGAGRQPQSVLTDREISVLQNVAEGMSNRRIGEELGLSALTVKSHLARISRKLGTGDRAALVAVSIRRGLI